MMIRETIRPMPRPERRRVSTSIDRTLAVLLIVVIACVVVMGVSLGYALYRLLA